MNKWIIPALASFALTPLSYASDLAYLYKDMRIMGMGGANVASGGYSSSLFSNPAGIANLPTDHGLIVELLGISATGSSNASDVFNDLSDAIDSDSEDEIIKVLEKYSGERTHIDVANYSSISNNHGNYAWSIGLLAATDINLTAHANSLNLLEVQSRAYGGLTGAYAYTLRDVGKGDLQLGLGAKFLTQKSFEGPLTTADLLSGDDLGDELRDKMEEDNSGFAVDLGAIYQFHTDNNLKPALGLSVMNIGSVDFNDTYGGQPTTVNIGASIEPKIPLIKRTRIALDYVDLFNANKYRIYNLDDANDEVSYNDYEDTDFMKRLRFGISGLLYENHWSSMEVATGIYQGGLTGGIDFTASVFRIGLTTYEEQTGPQYGDAADRRYSLAVGMAW